MRVRELWVLSLVVVVCLGGFMIPAAYADDLPENTWLFEEGVGIYTECLPDNLNEAELDGTAGWSSSTPRAHSNWCVTLNGIDGYVWTPLFTNDWPQISVEAWIYVNEFLTEVKTIPPGSTATYGYSYIDQQVIVGNDSCDGYSANAGFEFYVEGDKLGVSLTRSQAVWADTTLDTGTWTHVAFTFDRYVDGNNVFFYINGQRAGEGDIRHPLMMTHLVTIGRSPTEPREYLNGRIDEVLVYNSVRSEGRIKLDYENGPLAAYTPESAPVAALNRGAAVEWASVEDYHYQVEWSPDNATWEARSPVIYGTGDTMEWADDTTTSFHQPGQSYYRVMQLTDYY